MSTENGNLPAAPTQEIDTDINGDQIVIAQTNGLTKREYIAAQALQGFLVTWNDAPVKIGPKEYAAMAVEAADALLEELEK